MKPIIFSTPMVQSILAGRKTQTRRLIKPAGPDRMNIIDGKFTGESGREYIPKYQPGDILWVRESYVPGYFDNGGNAYKSDWNKVADEYINEPKWKPSIHMPKSAARIFLEVTNVRADRLQNISEDDAKNEGAMKVWEDEHGNFYHPESDTVRMVGDYGDYRTGFKAIWKSINGPESWGENPWVWVYEFKRIELLHKAIELAEKAEV